MKKSTLTLSSLTILLATSAMAQAAAPTAELKVIGEITAPSCTVTPPDNGVYDFGKTSSTLIKPAAVTTLTKIVKTWSVSCNAETYLTFTVVDNRASSVASTNTYHFGLGHVNTTGKIGYYTALMSAAKVDGVAARTFIAASGGAITPSSGEYIAKGYNIGWASASTSTLQSGRVFSADITVTPTLSSSATMGGPVTDTVNLDGLMTMSFAFGV